MRHRFLLRNRLIAASSRATVVVEAGWRSGALNTARHALELSRVVAAYPGSVYSAASAGTHRLIRDREAELVTAAVDVIDLMRSGETLFTDGEVLESGAGGVGVGGGGANGGDGGYPKGAGGAGANGGGVRSGGARGGSVRGGRVIDDRLDDLAEREKICLSALSATKVLDVGTIAARAGLPVPDTLSALALLELAGLSERDGGGWKKLRRARL